MYLSTQKSRVVSAAIAAVLCAVCVLALKSPVHAAGGLTISPPLREITIGPGLLETSADITLQNNTESNITAHLQLIDLKALGQFGGTTLDQSGLSDKYNLANWMSLPGGDTILVNKGETVKVGVKITNRQDLTPGGHYGAVVITTSTGNSVTSNVNISQQLISLIFVKKLGGEVFGLELEPFSYTGSAIPDKITTRFKSTGNVHVVPRGYVDVTDPGGREVAKGILNQDSSMILPGSSRQFVTLLQSVAAANKLGRYKITVHYRYDGQSDFKTQTIYFTHGVPITRLLPIGGAILVLIAVSVYLTRKHRINKRTQHS